MRTSNSHNIKDHYAGEWETTIKEVVVVFFNLITRHSLKDRKNTRHPGRYVSAEQTCSIQQNYGTKLVKWKEHGSAYGFVTSCKLSQAEDVQPSGI